MRAAAAADRAARARRPAARAAKWILENWATDAAEVRQGVPARVQARAGNRAKQADAAQRAGGAAPARQQRRAGDRMGKATGFMEYTRETAARGVRSTERVNDWFEIYQDFPGRQGAHAGRALHGLRRSVLPYRLSGEQHHSGLERPGVSRALERSDPRAALHQQFPGVHRAHLSRRRAKPPACSASTSRR